MIRSTQVLWLVRHGESTWNTLGLAQGHCDQARLTRLGQRQAWAEACDSLAEPLFDMLAAAVLVQRPAGGELTPLFDVGQSTVSPHHLKVLTEAGIVDSERPGLWAYYYVLPEGLRELARWLGDPAPREGGS